jgi:hypothetical protein
VLAGRLEVPHPTVSVGGELAYAVVNDGDVPIMLGEDYEVERFGAAGWERIDLGYAFRLWGRRLAPGARFKLTARVPERLVPGRYRLCKRLIADRDPQPGYEWVAQQEIEPVDVTAEFEVVAGRPEQGSAGAG